MGQSVRELKAQLAALGVDFSHCREKNELEQLLVEAEERKSAEGTKPAAASGLEDGGFAQRRSDGRFCWVEFVDDDDALCQWSDGTDAILPAADLDQVDEDNMPGPAPFQGSFEEARAQAFCENRLLVAAVRKGGKSPPKAERLQVLGLASGEAAPLIGENAVFWQGTAGELRDVHQQQLAPQGAPSLAMVLPLAPDAMRVLSKSDGADVEVVVSSFVEALEALESHKEAAAARLVSESAQLRMEQDEEYAAALIADQHAAAKREEAEARNDPDALRSATDSEPTSADSVKRPSVTEEPEKEEDEAADREQEERMVKARRLADSFAEESPPSRSSACRLVLKLPSGERVERTFDAADPLSRVHRWAECCHLLPEAKGRELKIPQKFALAQAFPSRKLGPEEAEMSLSELGLAPSAALLLIDQGA